MVDRPIGPVDARTPLSNTHPPARPAAATEAATPVPGPSHDPAGVIVDFSKGVIDDADGEGAGASHEVHGGDDAEDFGHGLEKAIDQISKALERLLRRIDHLQDKAERAGQKLFRDLTRDIAEGRFEDHTPDKAVRKLLHRLEHIGEKAEKAEEKFGDAMARILGKIPLAEEAGGVAAALSVTVSQSITLSVENLELVYQDNDSTVHVSYQKISFSVTTTTTIGAAFAGNVPRVLDLGGNPFATADIGGGIFVDAGAPDVAGLLDGLRSGGLTAPAGDGVDAGAQSPAQDALDTLILFREVTTSASFDLTRILIDAVTRFPAADEAADKAADKATPLPALNFEV